MFPLPTFFCRRGDLKRLSYKELFRPRHRMQHLPVLVNHAQLQRGGRGGEDGEARLGAAEDGAFHGLHLAAEGAGGVGDVVYRAARHADVLEVVDVAVDVHGHVAVAAQDAVHAALHVLALDVVLRRLGVDGVMAHDYDPVFLGRGKHAVQPTQLLVDVLLAGVGILGELLAVLVDEGRGVDEDDAHGGAFLAERLGVVAGGHLPAAAHAAVVHDGLRRAAIFVVSTDGMPVNHQFGVRVDKLEVGHPQGVFRGAHALEVVDVAGGNNAFGTDFLGHHAHQFGDGLLVVVAVAAQVVGDVEVALVVVDAVVYLRFLGRCPLAQQGDGE